MVVVPITSISAYYGLGKQSAQGSPVAPTIFFRWEDGSSLEFDLKVEDVWEGDLTRMLSFLVKTQQSVKFKIVHAPRPIELGFVEQACAGAGSDTLGTTLLSTTTTTIITAATSSTVTLTSVTGLPGSGTVAMVLEAGTANEEIALFTLPPSGSVLTLAAAYNGGTGKFALSHTSGVAIKTQSIHTIPTPQADGSYFTAEISLGGTAGLILRITDCKLDQLKLSGKPGLIMFESDWIGIASVVRTSVSTVTFENHQPFLYFQGVWTLNGVTTGNALAVEKFDIARKNNLDPVQTEALTFAAMIFGRSEVDVAIDEVYQDSSLIGQAYFGTALNTTPIAGATDSQTIVNGSLTLAITQADTFNAVTYTLNTLVISKVGMPVPKTDGKHFMQALSLASVSNMGANAYTVQAKVNNTQYTAY